MSLSLSTMHLFSRELEKATERHNRFADDSTDSDEGRVEQDLKLERKLASIRLSTRHLRAKLLAECDEVERARVSNTSLHQYRRQPPTLSPQPQISPTYPTQMVNPYLAYQMSLSSWLACSYPAMFNSWAGSNPNESMQNMNYMPLPARATSWPYSSYYPSYYYLQPQPSVPAHSGFNTSPYAMPMISETYNHFAKVDHLCREESQRMKQFAKDVRRVPGDTGIHEEDDRSKKRKHRKHHHHHHHHHEHKQR